MNDAQLWETLARCGKAERNLREAFKSRGAELIQTYRHGPYKIEALFRVEKNHYWTVASRATRERAWTQSELDAWLHEDLVVQLDRWRRDHDRGEYRS